MIADTLENASVEAMLLEKSAAYQIEAMSIGAKRGLAAANLTNSYLLNAGDVYSEGGDRPTARYGRSRHETGAPPESHTPRATGT